MNPPLIISVNFYTQNQRTWDYSRLWVTSDQTLYLIETVNTMACLKSCGLISSERRT